MIHHHWVFSKIHLQFSSSDAITCKHSLTAKYVSLSRYASRKIKPYAAYILQGVRGSRVLIIIISWPPPLVWAANDHFCGDDDQRIEDPSHRHSRVRRPLLWNLLSRAKFNHLLLFNISYQLPHIWMILMALMSRPLRLNRPNFKRSENRGHLRPFNSHFQMLKCVIIQVVLLFDKVLAFDSSVQPQPGLTSSLNRSYLTVHPG